MEIEHFPQEKCGMITCFVCFRDFISWNSYAFHYSGHSQLDPESYHNADSVYWRAQMYMFLEIPSLATIMEYRMNYDEKV
jgi:hypothetical protein